MCGIAALFSYRSDGPPTDRAELTRIRDRMAPRGPDGAGTWMNDDHRVGLAHRRLAIIDLSEQGHQPMASHDGARVISFNGEIYNYRVLRDGLEKKGYRFHSQSDTEVLLHLYEETGEAMVEHLRGMYAFALWDARRRRLFLARDPYGIKPLYYADDGACFRAASQVKALLAGGAVDTRPEPAGQVGFYLWGHVPEPFTLYRGVRALPAGCSLRVDAHGPHPVRQFAEVPAALAEAEQERSSLSEDEAPAALRDALLDTVRHHLVADVEVGVFLSAGLDSTTLAALTAEAGAASAPSPSPSTNTPGRLTTRRRSPRPWPPAMALPTTPSTSPVPTSPRSATGSSTRWTSPPSTGSIPISSAAPPGRPA